MEVKFFPRDVIGTQPKKVGDTFKALFLGRTHLFKVVHYAGNFFMAEFV